MVFSCALSKLFIDMSATISSFDEKCVTELVIPSDEDLHVTEDLGFIMEGRDLGKQKMIVL